MDNNNPDNNPDKQQQQEISEHSILLSSLFGGVTKR